ncbi:MAG: DUF4340 domain-containing protein [Verrucomicrobiaceae bacterium]|nr:MAG: DUF4340 domain-containing protein [Verrucomicrobiaceae bacterium]
MKIRTTILLLLLTAGLLCYVFLHERRQPPRNLAGYLVFDLEGDLLVEGKMTPEVTPEEVAGIDLKSGAGNFAFRKQDDGTWDIARGLKDRANPKAITTMLDFVAKAKILETIDEDEVASGRVRESELGLDDSNEIELTYRKPGGGKLVSLRLGRTAPLGNAMYLRFDGVKSRRDIYLVHPDLHEFAAQPADAYRDPSLLKYKPENLRRVSVKRGEGVIEMSRPITAPDDSSLWVITRPLANARADQDLVGKFLKELASTQIQSFTPAGSNTAAPTDPSIVEITLWGVNDPDKKGSTLSFYPDPAADSKSALCRDSERRAEFKVDKALVDDLAQIDSPNIFRDQHLGNIDPSKVTFLEVQWPEGADSVQLYRVGNNWYVRKTGTEDFLKADGGRVVSLINTLNESEVDFASDTLTDKAVFGFDKPITTLIFASSPHQSLKQLGPVTTENSRVLRFGRPPGKPGYANFAGEPYVYKVGPEALQIIPQQIIRWRTLDLPSFDPQQLQTLHQAVGASPPVDLAYKPLKFEWTATRAGEDVTSLLNVQAAERLVPVLANLEVASWQSESEKSLEALAQAPIVIEATYEVLSVKSPTPKVEKIRLEFAPMGSAEGGRILYYGRHSLVPGVFLIKGTTVQELIQPLLKTPA